MKNKIINKVRNIHERGYKEEQVYFFQGRVLRKTKFKKIREEDSRRALF